MVARAPRNGVETKRTIRWLREGRGEPQSQLVTVLRGTTSDGEDLVEGSARPSGVRPRELAEHVGVSQDDIDLEPDEPRSPGEQIVDAVERA